MNSREKMVIFVGLAVLVGAGIGMAGVAFLGPATLTNAQQQLMDMCERVAFGAAGFLFGNLPRLFSAPAPPARGG